MTSRARRVLHDRVGDNIGVGEISQTSEYLDAERPLDVDALVPGVIRSASDESLASSLLPQLPGRWGQMLGRRFDEGVELSGGEWQKIALARAYVRDAQVLILDEPTAALDARSEYEAFLRFSKLMAGRTAVIISHRFSTVRMADRIVVLRYGTLLEGWKGADESTDGRAEARAAREPGCSPPRRRAGRIRMVE